VSRLHLGADRGGRDLQLRRARVVPAGGEDLRALSLVFPSRTRSPWCRRPQLGRWRRTPSGRTSSTARASCSSAVRGFHPRTTTPYMQLYQAAAVADRGIRSRRVPPRSASTRSRIGVRQPDRDDSIIRPPPRRSAGAGALESADGGQGRCSPSAGASAETLFALGCSRASLLAARRSSAVDGLRRRGSCRAPSVRVSRRVPGSAPCPRAVTAQIDRHRRGRRAYPREPHRPADHDADPERDHTPVILHVHPDPGQPALGSSATRPTARASRPSRPCASRSSRSSPPSSWSSPCSAGSASPDSRARLPLGFWRRCGPVRVRATPKRGFEGSATRQEPVSAVRVGTDASSGPPARRR